MTSPWMAVARTARWAFQQASAPTLVAGGLMVSISSPSPFSPGQPNPWYLSYTSYLSLASYPSFATNMVRCEGGAAAVDPKGSSPKTHPHHHHRQTRPTTSTRTATPKTPTPATSINRRMTNVGRFSLLSETPTNPSVPVLVLCLSGKPWTARDFSQLYQERRIGEKHERFRSTLNHPHNSQRHFVVPAFSEPDSGPSSSSSSSLSSSSSSSLPVYDVVAYPQIYRNELKTMITDALLLPMDLSQSLWQAWMATGGKIGQSGAIATTTTNPASSNNNNTVESLLLFRAHHCMADGVSLGAIFGDLMDEGEFFQQMIREKLQAFRRKRKSLWKRLQIFLYYWCWGSIRAVAYQLYLYFSSMISPNPWKVIQQAAAEQQQELPNNENPHVRTLSWVQIASVDEVKRVAEYFTNEHHEFNKAAAKRQKMTVNDIFCSCVTGATAKLMDHHRQQQKNWKSLSLPYLNLVIPVHMQGGLLLPGQSMGNKIGAIVSRVPAEAADGPAERLHQVHDALWNRKQTPTAALSYIVANTFGGTLGTLLGPRVTSWLFSKAHANASVVVTNVRGPETTAHLDGRRVEANLGFLPLPPGVPIGIVVMSYNQMITLTVMAEPWAVPDADLFLSWVVEEYQQLLNQSRKVPS